MGAVYTLEEAAERLRKTARWLRDWLRHHPVDAAGVPFYSPMGRTKTFDEGDLARIRSAEREAERCRLNLLRPATRKRKTSISEAATLELQLTEAAGLTGDRSLLESLNGSNRRSSEGNIRHVDFPKRRGRPS